MTHPFDGSNHDGWCADCGAGREAPIHSKLFLCTMCLKPYEKPLDGPKTFRCEKCRPNESPGWVEAWERSKAIQKGLRDAKLRATQDDAA